MARARSFPARGRPPRRQVTWIGPASQGFQSVGSTNSVIIASFDPAANGLAKPTVVRTRGEVTIRPATAVVTDLEVTAAYGLAVVSDKAFAAGAASIPEPFDDAGWDGWFVWRSISYSQEAGDATGFTVVSHSQEVDSKAMRKVTDDETIVLMAQSKSGAFRIDMPLRLLLKLS